MAELSLYLVDLLPALQVLGPDVGVVVQQRLGDGGVRGGRRAAVVQRRQVLAVPVVGARAQLQHRAHRLDIVRGHLRIQKYFNLNQKYLIIKIFLALIKIT